MQVMETFPELAGFSIPRVHVNFPEESLGLDVESFWRRWQPLVDFLGEPR